MTGPTVTEVQRKLRDIATRLGFADEDKLLELLSEIEEVATEMWQLVPPVEERRRR